MRIVVDARTVRPGATGVGHFAAGLLRGFDALADCETTALRLATVDHAAGWLGPFWRGLSRVRVVDVQGDYECHPRGDWWLHAGGMDRAVRAADGQALVSPAFVCPWGRRKPYARVVVVHDTLAWDEAANYPLPFRAYIRVATRLSARCADLVATTSPTVRRRMAHLGIGRERASVVPPGIDRAVFRPSPHRDRDAGRRPMVVCPGSFEPRKNHATLFEALRRSPLRELDPRLVLLHDTRDSRRADILLLARGLDVEIAAPHSPERMADLLRLADAVALPSRAEGFGLSLLESMACGTPIVASDIDVFRWLSMDGACASLVPHDDPDAWARALVAAVDGDTGAQRRNAVARAAKFDWKRTAAGMLRLAKESVDR